MYCGQGRIEPPKAARGHATFVDGKMLSVTKYRIQIVLVKHVTADARPLCGHLLPSGSSKWLASLATELETYAKANIELLSRVVNVALASGDTLTCYTGRSGTRTSTSTCAS